MCGVVCVCSHATCVVMDIRLRIDCRWWNNETHTISIFYAFWKLQGIDSCVHHLFEWNGRSVACTDEVGRRPSSKLQLTELLRARRTITIRMMAQNEFRNESKYDKYRHIYWMAKHLNWKKWYFHVQFSSSVTAFGTLARAPPSTPNTIIFELRFFLLLCRTWCRHKCVQVHIISARHCIVRNSAYWNARAHSGRHVHTATDTRVWALAFRIAQKIRIAISPTPVSHGLCMRVCETVFVVSCEYVLCLIEIMSRRPIKFDVHTAIANNLSTRQNYV